MSKHRGHEIEEIDPEVWVYRDTRQPVAENPDRECGSCGLPNTVEGHDACLGAIPGVMNACCGHGGSASAYVQLRSGDVRQMQATAGERGSTMASRIQTRVRKTVGCGCVVCVEAARVDPPLLEIRVADCCASVVSRQGEAAVVSYFCPIEANDR